jgi:hypothetical protein
MANIKVISPTTGESIIVTDEGLLIDDNGDPVKVTNIKEAIKKLKEEESKWNNKDK